MGFGSFLFSALCVVSDTVRPSHQNRRRAQKDSYNRTYSFFSGSPNKGTCFSCNGTGSKTVDCRGCSGTGLFSRACNGCNGTGLFTSQAKPCFACNGTGKFHPHRLLKGVEAPMCRKCSGTGIFKATTHSVCTRCHGSGNQSKSCNRCNGTGRVKLECKKCSGKGEIDFKS